MKRQPAPASSRLVRSFTDPSVYLAAGFPTSNTEAPVGDAVEHGGEPVEKAVPSPPAIPAEGGSHDETVVALDRGAARSESEGATGGQQAKPAMHGGPERAVKVLAEVHIAARNRGLLKSDASASPAQEDASPAPTTEVESPPAADPVPTPDAGASPPAVDDGDSGQDADQGERADFGAQLAAASAREKSALLRRWLEVEDGLAEVFLLDERGYPLLPGGGSEDAAAASRAASLHDLALKLAAVSQLARERMPGASDAGGRETVARVTLPDGEVLGVAGLPWGWGGRPLLLGWVEADGEAAVPSAALRRASERVRQALGSSDGDSA